MDRINNNNESLPKVSSNQGKSKVLSKEEKMNLLVPKSKEFFSDMVSREVPENGLFRNVFITLTLPESQNKALLSVEQSSKDPKTLRNLLLGVKHKDRDRLTSVYLKQNCSKAEILKYLNDKSNDDDIKKTIQELSDKTDDYYSTL